MKRLARRGASNFYSNDRIGGVMASNEGRLRLLGMSGSLRKNAYSTALLRRVIEELSEQVEVNLWSLADIPLYNEEHDREVKPPAVAAFKHAIGTSHGLIISSPEYNYGISGVLKNALDWASRPGYKSVLKDKPVIFMTSSPGALGGVRAQAQLRQTLAATLSRMHIGPELVVNHIGEKVKAGRFEHEGTLKLILDETRAFIDGIGPSISVFDPSTLGT
jgi:chromate reductase